MNKTRQDKTRQDKTRQDRVRCVTLGDRLAISFVGAGSLLVGLLATVLAMVSCTQDQVPNVAMRRSVEISPSLTVASNDPDELAFVRASRTAFDYPDGHERMVIQRSETGVVRMVFGAGFRVPLTGLGCNTADLGEGALCFLRSFQQAFGITDPDGELVLLDTREEPGGHFVALFNQQFQGYPVFGRQILVTLSSDSEVSHVYSTLAAPLTGPGIDPMEGDFAGADPQACLDAARTHALDDRLTADSAMEVLWPMLSGDTYTAVPAISLATRGPGDSSPSHLFIVDAASAAVLESRALVATYPSRQLWGYARHPAMTTISSHPTCTVDGDCSYLGTGWVCSTDFSPRRCFKECTSDVDCDYSDYTCYLPDKNYELVGYCHWRAVSGDPKDGYQVWTSTGGWYNSALSDHLAYEHLQVSLNDLVSHHYYDLGLTSSYDGANGTYWVNLHDQCWGCETLPPTECDCDCEYSACGALGSVSFGDPKVTIGFWKSWWEATSAGSVSLAEYVLGHEWGHVLVGSGYGWSGSWPLDCVSESAADTYGALFGVSQLGATYAIPGCAGYSTSPYRDDRAGLNPGCRSDMLKTYAYRSRFDLLACSGSKTWYTTCSSSSDCPAYQACERDPLGVQKCTNSPDPHNGGLVFFRFLRILAEGSGVFASDGHAEDLGIPNSPVGLATTMDIVNYANRRMSSTTTVKDWMYLLLAGGSAYGKYTEVYRALGASGFFPNQTLLSTYTTDRDPIAITFPAWYYPSDKTFVIWKESGAYNLKVRYNNGGTPTVATIAANTIHRPTAVVHGSYLHIYYRDRSTGQIKVQLIHYNGWFYGPYNVDPGPGQLRPTGAFEAVRHQSRVYLIFADSLNSSYLSIARCDNSVYCASSWHDFGGGAYKKIVRSLAVLPGMSGASASDVHGRRGYTDLYIAAGEYYGGRVFVTRVNSDDSTGTSFYIPNYYPSYTTITGLGIEARRSALPYISPPFWYPQNYLYLVWKNRTSSAIYTSVLQDAPSSGTYRFTKSQPAYWDAKADTGVSWAKGNAVTDNIQGVFVSPTNSMVYQFNGYGRY